MHLVQKRRRTAKLAPPPKKRGKVAQNCYRKGGKLDEASLPLLSSLFVTALSLLSLSPFQSYVKLSGLSVVAAEASEEGSKQGPRLWEEDEGTVSLSEFCGGVRGGRGGGDRRRRLRWSSAVSDEEKERGGESFVFPL